MEGDENVDLHLKSMTKICEKIENIVFEELGTNVQMAIILCKDGPNTFQNKTERGLVMEFSTGNSTSRYPSKLWTPWGCIDLLINTFGDFRRMNWEISNYCQLQQFRAASMNHRLGIRDDDILPNKFHGDLMWVSRVEHFELPIPIVSSRYSRNVNNQMEVQKKWKNIYGRMVTPIILSPQPTKSFQQQEEEFIGRFQRLPPFNKKTSYQNLIQT